MGQKKPTGHGLPGVSVPETGALVRRLRCKVPVFGIAAVAARVPERLLPQGAFCGSMGTGRTMADLMDDIPRDQLSGALRRGAVKKHVAAIHVSGKLTLLQRKLSNVLLLNAYDTLMSRPSHQIDARTLCLMIGYNSNDMDTLKQSLRGLV